MNNDGANLPTEISAARLDELLEAIQPLRVAVLGDFSLAGTWHADMTRAQVSAETPLYPRPVVRERYACGGAANLAWNLAALGAASTRCLGVLGEDWRGDVLRRILGEVGVDSSDMLRDPNWRTPFSAKILLETDARSQEDARLDFLNTQPLAAESEQDLLLRLSDALPRLDALLIADFLPEGVVTPTILEQLNQLAEQYPDLVVAVTSRTRIGQFTNMVRKPNRQQAAAWLFPDQAVESVTIDQFAGAALHPQVDCGCPLWITLGSDGCLVISGGESHTVPARRVSPPLDLFGAGDTFLAAASLALAAGAGAVEAAQLGNLAASVTIRIPGITGAATPEDLRKQLAST